MHMLAWTKKKNEPKTIEVKFRLLPPISMLTHKIQNFKKKNKQDLT